MGGGCSRSRWPLDGVLWDLDGTLIDTSSSSFLALAEILKDLLALHNLPESYLDLNILLPTINGDATAEDRGKRVAIDDEPSKGNKSEWASAALVQVKLDGLVQPEELVSRWESAMIKRRAEIPLLPGASELVRHFKAHGVPQAIATMSSSRSVAMKRKNNEELFSYMDTVVCGDDNEVRGKRKPDPTIYLVAARRLNASPLRCVVIEDSPEGMRAGANAGAKVVGVPAAWTDPRKIGRGVQVDVMIDSLVKFPTERFRGLKKLKGLALKGVK